MFGVSTGALGTERFSVMMEYIPDFEKKVKSQI
jgi:hypothetical protein